MSVCLEVVEIPPNLVGLRLIFSTNRSAQTDNPIDRQNFEADKRASDSEELVKLLSDLIAEHGTSRTQPNTLQHGEHEDLLLQFLIKRSKARVIKKATDLYKQTEGLGTTLKKLVLPPNPNHPTVVVTNWVDSLAKLRRLAKPITNKNNALVPKQIRVLSEYCAFLLTRPVFERIMRARIRTLENGTPNQVDDSSLRHDFGIPSDWKSEELISVAKLGRRLNRFASFKSGASAICADLFPGFVKWVEEKKRLPASPFFGPPIAIGTLVNTEICFVLPPDIWTEPIIQTDSRIQIDAEAAASMKTTITTAWNSKKNRSNKSTC